MCRLPVVEGFVAVLNRREECGDDVGGEEDVECVDGLDRVGAVASGGRARALCELELQLEPEGLRTGEQSLLLLRMAGGGMFKGRAIWRRGWRSHRGCGW